MVKYRVGAMLILFCVCSVVMASFYGDMERAGIVVNGSSFVLQKPLVTAYAISSTGTVTTTAVATFPKLTSTQRILTVSEVSLTSPTVTIAAAGKGLIILNSDANQTGCVFTGGVVGQELKVITGAGNNTVRFDDATTSMALGGNITLTEGQSDSLTLVCTSADGDEWSCVAAHDN